MTTTPAESLRAQEEDLYRLLAELAGSLDAEDSAEAILQIVGIGATLAANSHLGRFADGLLENHALRVAQALSKKPFAAGRSTSRQVTKPGRQVLHVASMVFGIGGHSRMILEWVARDPTSVHSLVVTNQDPLPPEFSCAPLYRSGGAVWTLGCRTPCTERALRLRALAAGFDLVVLHTWPGDVIPLAAFGAASGPPVALLNHADHIFWMGNTISDAVINLRPVGAELSLRRRFAQKNLLMPIPVGVPDPAPGRTEARQRLGLPDSQVVLVSVGRSTKYAPTKSRGFFTIAARVLTDHPDVHLYLLGPSVEDFGQYCPGTPVPDRMHLLGPIDDSATWLASADVYLESFPFGSQTATLEAAMLGPAIVLALAPTTPLLAASDVAFDGILTNPTSEAEYHAQVDAHLSNLDASRLLGARLTASVQRHHASEYWNECLDSIYQSLLSTPHAPRPLPVATPMETSIDVAIREWQDATPRGDEASRIGRDLASAAYWAREAGEWRAGIRMLKWASMIGSVRRPRWGATTKILVRAALSPVWPRELPSDTLAREIDSPQPVAAGPVAAGGRR